jgi:ABC-type nitrate/sulfonate/bicarbonate transport system permease component
VIRALCIIAFLAVAPIATAGEVVDPHIMDASDCVVQRDDVWPTILEHDTGYSVYTIFIALVAGVMFGMALSTTHVLARRSL